MDVPRPPSSKTAQTAFQQRCKTIVFRACERVELAFLRLISELPLFFFASVDEMWIALLKSDSSYTI
jgi:hypothetical protein